VPLLHDDRPRISVPIDYPSGRILRIGNTRWALSVSLTSLMAYLSDRAVRDNILPLPYMARPRLLKIPHLGPGRYVDHIERLIWLGYRDRSRRCS
jgi:hypothetical protein